MQKNEVKSLIESIKSQTEQLKNTVRNCVGIKKIAATSPSNEPEPHSSSVSKKPQYRKKLNHEILEAILRNPENQSAGQQNPEFLHEVIEENEELKMETQTLKKSLLAAVSQCKLLKRELDEEKRKTARLSQIEQEYAKEKRKNALLTEKNFELKKQALSLMNKVKAFLAGCEKEAAEGIQDQARLQQENDLLREALSKQPAVVVVPTTEKPPIDETAALSNTPKNNISNNNAINNSRTLKDLTEEYKKVKDQRKETREKLKIEAKNKEKTSNIFSYFQGNSQNEIAGESNSQSIIDMYEEKILQNSIKSGSSAASLNGNNINSANKDRSPLLSATLKRK